MGDAKRTIITGDKLRLIQAKQDRLVMSQLIRHIIHWKIIINPSPFMKNRRDDFQNGNINSKNIRTAGTRQQGKLNFKLHALRSSIILVTGERNLFWEKLFKFFFSIVTFLNYNLWVYVWDRVSTQTALFQNDHHLREPRPSRSRQQTVTAAINLANSAAYSPRFSSNTLRLCAQRHCASSKAKNGPVEKKAASLSSSGVIRSDDHFEDAAQFLRTLWNHSTEANLTGL